MSQHAPIAPATCRSLWHLPRAEVSGTSARARRHLRSREPPLAGADTPVGEGLQSILAGGLIVFEALYNPRCFDRNTLTQRCHANIILESLDFIDSSSSVEVTKCQKARISNIRRLVSE